MVEGRGGVKDVRRREKEKQETENRKQRTGNREQETENRKQRTGNREQETENRKQRTGNGGALACGSLQKSQSFGTAPEGARPGRAGEQRRAPAAGGSAIFPVSCSLFPVLCSLF
jgi:hypothetical protein